ncbi:hypothetical protein SUGI_1062200 [Cryptomeria japonica]|nr:hypothetical protein SUGI_1062200 [Cryptomeria japonica]
MSFQRLFVGRDEAPITFAVAIVVMMLIFYMFSRQRRRLPPGPFPWPIVGNLLQMGELIHRSFYDISKEIWTNCILENGFCYSKYLFYDFKDVGFTPYGPCWRQMKTLFMVELLNAKRIESMRSMREEAVSLAVRSVWEKSCHGTVAVNLNQIIASLVSSQILRILYGTASDDQGIDSNGEKIKELLLEASMTVGVFNIGDFTGLTGSICKVSSDDD